MPLCLCACAALCLPLCLAAISAFTENHLACRRLVQTCYGHIDRLIDPVAGVFYDDHRSVFEVTDALLARIAGFHDLDPQTFAGQKNRFHGISQIVDIYNIDAPELSDFVEIEIVSNQPAVAIFAKRYKLVVHRCMRIDSGRRRIVDPILIDRFN